MTLRGLHGELAALQCESTRNLGPHGMASIRLHRSVAIIPQALVPSVYRTLKEQIDGV